jgi:bifunctional DNA-binding transcriptional regulator/antitoxin component of YhaV-PrlF toxin-antitoxin module
MESITFQVIVRKGGRFVIPHPTNILLKAEPGDTLNLAVLSITRKRDAAQEIKTDDAR